MSKSFPGSSEPLTWCLITYPGNNWMLMGLLISVIVKVTIGCSEGPVAWVPMSFWQVIRIHNGRCSSCVEDCYYWNGFFSFSRKNVNFLLTVLAGREDSLGARVYMSSSNKQHHSSDFADESDWSIPSARIVSRPASSTMKKKQLEYSMLSSSMSSTWDIFSMSFELFSLSGHSLAKWPFFLQI